MWMDLPVVGHRAMEWVLRSMPLGGHLSSQLVVFVSSSTHTAVSVERILLDL